MRVLDIAAGAGNAALVAADAGADVVAGDLTPELLAAGRAAAAERGVEVTWREADAEALPFADAAFDVVMSCVGVMFAPRHQRTADELVRVCRPGGTIGLLNWALDGFIGQMFALMKPYAEARRQRAVRWPVPWQAERLVGDQRVNRLALVRAKEFDVTQPPGPSDQKNRGYLQRLFAGQIDGHPLLVNNSRCWRCRGICSAISCATWELGASRCARSTRCSACSASAMAVAGSR